jgi:SAM-dependent methyltransferase
MDVAGKRTLEIGIGQGAESEQLIRRGARWSGLDLTQESASRVGLRLMLRRLPYESIKVGSALRIPYDTASFDVVFSHGVLHHVPDIRVAQSEIHRVLKRDGRLVVMLYAKYSLNYLLSICLLRRLGLMGFYFLRPSAGGIYGAHLARAREHGLMRYMRMSNFIHRNTDGPDNPYSKVYSGAELRRDFPDFRIMRAHKEYLHAPPLNVHGLPGASLLGWHLWVHMAPR